VLRDGAIAEVGKHSELMLNDKHYAALVRRQQASLAVTHSGSSSWLAQAGT
jgi:ABC-type transport system involved in cytochrome bd biosynthesis fused ATPase/permease subunit